MMLLQEWIHKFEEGEGVRYIKVGTLILALFGVLTAYDLREYRSFATAEAMDTAQLARNIAEGRGYTTQFIRPVSFYLQQERREQEKKSVFKPLDQPHLDISNPPIYPYLLAGLMKVLPFNFVIPHGVTFVSYQPERYIGFLNQTLFVISIGMLFFLARRLFDSQVAWVATIVYAGADIFWRYSLSGLSTQLLVVLFLGAIWCLVSMQEAVEGEEMAATAVGTGEGGAPEGVLTATPDENQATKRSEWWFYATAGVLGLLLGLAALTRYSMGWLVLPVAASLLLFYGRRRLMLAGMAVLVFGITIAPWLIRNNQLSGQLFGTAGFALVEGTPRFPDTRLERSLKPNLKNVEPEDYARKLLVNLKVIFQTDIPKLGGSWVTALFLTGLLMPFQRRGLSRLRYFLLMCLAVMSVVQALGRSHLSDAVAEVNSENLLVIFSPLVFVYGAGMFLVLLDQIEFPFPQLRTSAIAAFCALCCGGLIFTFLPPRASPYAYPPYYPPYVQQYSSWLKDKELMMSDIPWAVAWYGDRPCMWHSLNINDFFAINDLQKGVSAVYLTQITTDAKFSSQLWPVSDDNAWGRFYLDVFVRTNIPAGFPLGHALTGTLPEQFYISDRPRWQIPGAGR